jgi:hypothetical protein
MVEVIRRCVMIIVMVILMVMTLGMAVEAMMAVKIL